MSKGFKSVFTKKTKDCPSTGTTFMVRKDRTTSELTILEQGTMKVRKFKVGDTAIHGSWNLVYLDEILSFTERTVTMKAHGRIKRLSMYEFCRRNIDLNIKDVEKRNDETMRYI